MRHRGHVDDLGDDYSCIVDGPDGRLASGAGALYEHLDLAETGIISSLGSILCSHLGGVGSILLGTPETAFSGGGPTDDLTLVVAQGDDHVVEG